VLSLQFAFRHFADLF
jgi:hypothetical protein